MMLTHRCPDPCPPQQSVECGRPASLDGSSSCLPGYRRSRMHACLYQNVLDARWPSMTRPDDPSFFRMPAATEILRLKRRQRASTSASPQDPESPVAVTRWLCFGDHQAHPLGNFQAAPRESLPAEPESMVGCCCPCFVLPWHSLRPSPLLFVCAPRALVASPLPFHAMPPARPLLQASEPPWVRKGNLYTPLPAPAPHQQYFWCQRSCCL
mmetsp:Transcript_13520/g.26616  ORF Transcript_13520/g.26616 Transcript_13520/m.26616 type:complete len:211 (-) Transcript_13520:615-1247(-)